MMVLHIVYINSSQFKSSCNSINSVLCYKENKVTMDIEPGDFFVVHYNFPSGEHKFSKDDLSKGSSMSIPEAKCSFRLPPISTTKGLTAKYKVSYFMNLHKVYTCMWSRSNCIYIDFMLHLEHNHVFKIETNLFSSKCIELPASLH